MASPIAPAMGRGHLTAQFIVAVIAGSVEIHPIQRTGPFSDLGVSDVVNEFTLQKEDLAAVDSILEAAYGPKHKPYHVDLNDDMMSPLLAVLKELADSGSR